MTNKKHFGVLLLSLFLLLAVACFMASCGWGDDKDPPTTTTAPTTTAPTTTAHVHVYTDTVVPPTCTEAGYTRHTCACGHSYDDAATAATGHDLASKVVRYPNTLSAGVRRYTCADCGHTYTEEIAVISNFTLPSVSDSLAASLPKGSFSIDTADAVVRIDREVTEVIDSVTLPPVVNNETYALRLAKAEFDVSDVVNGEVAIDFGTLNATEEFTSLFSFALLIAGDEISLTVGGDEDSFDLSEIYYAALAESMDMTVAELTELFYQVVTVEKYLPMFESILLAVIGNDSVEVFAAIATVIGAEIYTEESVTEGNVTTVTTTLDLGGLIAYLTPYVDATLADMIDDIYGEGTADTLFAYIESLPVMTVAEVADAAILASETYNIDIDTLFAFINAIVYDATDAPFDIEQVILSAYEMTLADVIVALSGEETTLTADEINASFTDAVAILKNNTLSAMYHDSNCPAEGDGAHAAADCDELALFLDYLSPVASNSLYVTTVETYTVIDDPEGAYESYELVSIDLVFQGQNFSFNEAGFAAIVDNGYVSVSLEVQDGLLTLEACDEGVPVFEILPEMDGEELLGYYIIGYQPADTDPFYAVSFKYWCTQTDEGEIFVYDVTADPAELTDNEVVVHLAAPDEGDGFLLSVYAPHAPYSSTEKTTPFLALGLSVAPDVLMLAYEVCEENGEEYGLSLVAGYDEEGIFTIILADSINEIVHFGLAFIPDAEGETFNIALNILGATFTIAYQGIDSEGVATYALLIEEVEVATLSIGAGGAVLDFPNEEFIVSGALAMEKSAEDGVYTCTFTVDGLSLYLEELYKNIENGYSYTTIDTIANGEIVFTYTPPVAE